VEGHHGELEADADDDEGGAACGGLVKGRYAWATRNPEEWPKPLA